MNENIKVQRMNEAKNESVPAAMDLDPIVAKKLFEEGAFLIIGGVPKGTEFGIDLWSHTIGDDFRGVKMIPPGLHYVWTASTGPYGDCAPRVGFAHVFQSQEILVREWDNKNEELRKRQSPQAIDEIEKIRQHLKNLDRFLAPYDLRSFRAWHRLVSLVSANTVERCQPELEIIRTCAELQSCSDADRPRGGNSLGPSLITLAKYKITANEDELLPHLEPVPGTAPRFTHVPERVPRNCSPSEISQHAIDCIEACRTLINSLTEAEVLIEEVQLSFAFFVVGHSIESLAFWRRILEILSHSEEAILLYREIYMKYCKMLSLQLPHLPIELLEASDNNTIYKDVRNLLINLKMAGLVKTADNLMAKLCKSMNWNFDGLLDENPEDRPVLVLTDELI